MTDHDAIAARVRQCAEHARPCDCEVDDCIHDRAYQDAPDYDELSAAYLNLYDEVKRLRDDRDAALERETIAADAAVGYLERAENAEAERDRVAAEWAETSQRNYQRAKAAEAERVAEWNRRREAEASRDLEKAVCATLKAERDAMRAALVDHNDLLRSASQIARREGIDGEIASTNWDAYYNRVAVVLKRHHEIANTARQALKGQTND